MLSNMGQVELANELVLRQCNPDSTAWNPYE